MTSNKAAEACDYHALATARPVESCDRCIGGGRTYVPIRKSPDGFPLTHERLWERVAIGAEAPNGKVIKALKDESRETLEERLTALHSGNTVIGVSPRERAISDLLLAVKADLG